MIVLHHIAPNWHGPSRCAMTICSANPPRQPIAAFDRISPIDRKLDDHSSARVCVLSMGLWKDFNSYIEYIQ